MKKFAAVVALVALVSACTENVTLVPTGGSKSDGIVTMSYDRHMIDNSIIDWSQATATAAQRCSGWGYGGAERFGIERRQCLELSWAGDGGCIRERVSIDYQCTG